MKYPLDIFSLVRNKTFSVTAKFVREENENPLKIFDDTFSRFVFAVIEDGKAATCNIPLDDIEEYRAITEVAKTEYYTKKPASGSGPAGKASTLRFMAGNLKGKTPVEVLLENPETGKKMLDEQYKYLEENSTKYPKNKELMAAIKEALSADLSEVSASCSTVPYEIIKIGCRPLVRKSREDGMCFCYEASVTWDSTRKYPVSVNIKNYYAPVIKNEDGTLNVQITKKDAKSEVSNTFNMTAAEWLNALRTIERTVDNFVSMHFASAYKLAEAEDKKNRTGTGTSSETKTKPTPETPKTEKKPESKKPEPAVKEPEVKEPEIKKPEPEAKEVVEDEEIPFVGTDEPEPEKATPTSASATKVVKLVAHTALTALGDKPIKVCKVSIDGTDAEKRLVCLTDKFVDTAKLSSFEEQLKKRAESNNTLSFTAEICEKGNDVYLLKFA